MYAKLRKRCLFLEAEPVIDKCRQVPMTAVLIYYLGPCELNNPYNYTGGPYPLPAASRPEMPLFQRCTG